MMLPGKNKQKTSTKRGPGRVHEQGDGLHKDLTLKQNRAGMFGKGLRNAITHKQRAELKKS